MAKNNKKTEQLGINALTNMLGDKSQLLEVRVDAAKCIVEIINETSDLSEKTKLIAPLLDALKASKEPKLTLALIDIFSKLLASEIRLIDFGQIHLALAPLVLNADAGVRIAAARAVVTNFGKYNKEKKKSVLDTNIHHLEESIANDVIKNISNAVNKKLNSNGANNGEFTESAWVISTLSLMLVNKTACDIRVSVRNVDVSAQVLLKIFEKTNSSAHKTELLFALWQMKDYMATPTYALISLLPDKLSLQKLDSMFNLRQSRVQAKGAGVGAPIKNKT
ncbi:MAG: hypothetical protein ABIH99_02695 [Candidatus Micrarchaeota archaeon]